MAESIHIVPKPFEVKRADLAGTVVDRLQEYGELYKALEPKIQKIFKEKGVPYNDPHMPGVMVRPEWGGGNYESFYVRQQPAEQSGGALLYTLRADDQEFTNLTASDVARKIQGEIVDKGSSDSYLVTRFMQVCESPGLNTVVGDDWYYAAPANGQIFDGSMCVGTSSKPAAPMQNGKFLYYGSQVNGKERDHHMNSSRKLAEFIAKQMGIEGGHGISGVDTMLSGFFEFAFALAVQGTEYEDEAVGPVTLAEVNVRPTQRTMHLWTQLAILNNLNGQAEKPITYEQLLTGYERTGKDLHYTSRDSYPVDPAMWKTLMGRSDLLAGINGTPNGIYVIMPPVGDGHSMGMGIMGTTSAAVQQYEAMLHSLHSGH